ncbi:MAG: hypothetical protein ACK5NN_12590 [Sphingomonadaceae bacterium]
MRQYDSQILHSPSDLVRYLGCAHATTLDLAKLRDPASAPAQAADDAMGEQVQQAGLAHEENSSTASPLIPNCNDADASEV